MGGSLVRKGKLSDITAVVEMGRDFWEHTAYDDPYCGDSVRLMAEACVANEMLSVIEINGQVEGFACGVVGPLLGNHAVLSGSELAWWVNPEHRAGRNGFTLLKHLEGLAKKAGVKHWNMMYMESSMPEAVEKMYKKLGYKKVETVYTRIL